MFTLAYSCFGVPAVALYLAEKLIIFHHPRTAGFVVVQVYKPRVAEFLAPAWQVFGYYMCVDVYFHWPVV
jgi:hypothetical protein